MHTGPDGVFFVVCLNCAYRSRGRILVLSVGVDCGEAPRSVEAVFLLATAESNLVFYDGGDRL